MKRRLLQGKTKEVIPDLRLLISELRKNHLTEKADLLDMTLNQFLMEESSTPDENEPLTYDASSIPARPPAAQFPPTQPPAARPPAAQPPTNPPSAPSIKDLLGSQSNPPPFQPNPPQASSAIPKAAVPQSEPAKSEKDLLMEKLSGLRSQLSKKSE
ncbi:MAG: hypothetical protein HWN66_01625 [Candidatus Helarchaeota archaeon]|nr:hypothetical protein [Candidatus Helarchaeota archaeon]